jgi:hypothetical protein
VVDGKSTARQVYKTASVVRGRAGGGAGCRGAVGAGDAPLNFDECLARGSGTRQVWKGLGFLATLDPLGVGLLGALTRPEFVGLARTLQTLNPSGLYRGV